MSVWSQHLYRETVCGHTLRYIRYMDMLDAYRHAGISMGDMSEYARITNKMAYGAVPTREDTDVLKAINSRIDPYTLWVPCFDEGLGKDDVSKLIDELPHRDAEHLMARLRVLSDPTPPECDTVAEMYTLHRLGFRVADIGELTAQQAGLLVAALTAEAKQ